MDEVLFARLLDKVEGSFFGKHQGVVVDNDDPEQLGRLKLQVPTVFGKEVVTGWALPCAPYGGLEDHGFLFVPEVGANVWVEFEAGHLERPIWVGTFWSKPGGASQLPKPNLPDGSEDSDVQAPPTRKIIKTVKGHTIQFEDAADEEMVLIVEAVNGNVVALNKDGITVTDGANTQTVVMDSAGITITDKTGNVIEMTDSAFNITSQVALSIKAPGQAVTISGSTIDFKKE